MNKNDLTVEEKLIYDAITSARTIEEYLWGEFNSQWNLEEWKRMFRKRINKIDDIDISNPHAKIELKKRLLQNSALSIALLGILETGCTNENCDVTSNLPEYDKEENNDIKEEREFIHNKYGYCYYDTETGGRALIFNLYVEPEYRRQGHATKLIQMVINEIRRTGYDREIEIVAEPYENSISLKDIIAFYEKMGLKVVKE